MHNCTNNAQWNYFFLNFLLAMGSWKLWSRFLILCPEVYRTGSSNVCKQWCNHIIALNSFRSAFSHSSSTERIVLVKPHLLALQNTALILLKSSAVIISENADRVYNKRANHDAQENFSQTTKCLTPVYVTDQVSTAASLLYQRCNWDVS